MRVGGDVRRRFCWCWWVTAPLDHTIDARASGPCARGARSCGRPGRLDLETVSTSSTDPPFVALFHLVDGPPTHVGRRTVWAFRRLIRHRS